MSTVPPKVKPSGLWYLVPVGILMATAVAAIVVAVSGFVAFDDTVQGFARIPVGGEGVVTFEDTGGFTAYYEEPSRAGAEVPDPSITVVITPVDGGDAVPTEPYFGSATYTVSGVSGRALATFSIEEVGDYRVQAQGSAPGDLAVGRSPFGKIGQGVLLALLVGAVGLVLAIVVVVVLAVKRGRSRRAIQAQLPPGPGGAPYGTPAYGAYGAPQYGTAPPAAWGAPPADATWPSGPPTTPPMIPPAGPPPGSPPPGSWPPHTAPGPWSPPGDPERPA